VFGDATKSNDCLQLLALAISAHVQSREASDVVSTRAIGSKFHLFQSLSVKCLTSSLNKKKLCILLKATTIQT